MSKRHQSLYRLPQFAALTSFTFLALAGCTDAEPLASLDGADREPMLAELPVEAEEKMALASLRRASAAYHNVEEAEEDGFVSLGVCVAQNPIDGQHPLGIPFVHLDRLLDGVLDPEEPEILFYEPRKDGTLRLAGVEMAIPVGLWNEEAPPEFFGQQFHENEAEGLYGLHVWIWLHNPEGLFATGNPRISCEFAP